MIFYYAYVEILGLKIYFKNYTKSKKEKKKKGVLHLKLMNHKNLGETRLIRPAQLYIFFTNFTN